MEGEINIQILYYYITLASVKILDNIISTEKTILTQKNRAFAASMLGAISQFMFFFLVSKVIADNNIISIIVVSIASGIGSYIAFFINNKFSKDRVYVNIVTSNDLNKMKSFGDYMRTEGIKVVTFPSYNDDVENTLTALVFTDTKEQNRKVDKYINKHDGFYREVMN